MVHFQKTLVDLGVPTAIKMSPAIQDGDIILGESGAIAQ
jgi:hypothetical protein